MTVAEAFGKTFESEPSGVWSAPGRVNLIGEHTDYNDGLVMPFAIEARTTVAASARSDGLLRMRSEQQPAGDISIPVEALAPGNPMGWAAYVAGVVWAARRRNERVAGLDVLVDGRVPPGGGLSSSHAIEVAVALAVDALFELGLDTDDQARLTQQAENEFIGAPTGVMDQLALLRARPGHALFLDTRSLKFEQVPLDPSADGQLLVVIDTRVRHSLADGAYGERRRACEQASAALGVPALRDVSVDGLDERLRSLDDVLARRARHVVTENARVPAAVAAVQDRDWPGLGRLMDDSHRSLRDDYEVSAAELDVAVETSRATGALGARMTGGGFGGSAIALVPAERVKDVRREVSAAFATRGWAPPVLTEVTPSAGARRDR